MRWNAIATPVGGILPWRYHIYRATTLGIGYTEVGVSPINAYHDTGLASSTTYYYRVSLEDEAGNFSAQYDVITYVSGLTGTRAAGAGPDLAAYPRTLINTRYVEPTGTTWNVNSGDVSNTGSGTTGGLQWCINSAHPGDKIVVPVATYNVTGAPLTMPTNVGNGWIYIVSANYGSLPAPGTRATAADKVNMPKIVANSTAGGQSAFQFSNNAHHFRFVGINFSKELGTSVAADGRIFDLGYATGTTVDTLPHDFIFDRCAWTGDPQYGCHHALSCNANWCSVICCHSSDIFQLHGFGGGGISDGQVVFTGTSAGPIKVDNCKLSASSEVILFGGVDPTVPNLVTQDNQITNNWFWKDTAWMTANPPGSIAVGVNSKNHFEVKNGAFGILAYNRFDNHWDSGQPGIWSFKATNSGASPGCQCQDWTVFGNFSTNSGSGIRLLAKNGAFTPENTTTRVTVYNNVVGITGLDPTGANAGQGWQFNFVGDAATDCVDLVISHNTILMAPITSGASQTANLSNVSHNQKLSFNNNILAQGAYGIHSSGGFGVGTAALNGEWNSSLGGSWEFLNNAIIGGTTAGYPPTVTAPANAAAVGFVRGDPASIVVGDYGLAAGSIYKAGQVNQASDGLDNGADINWVTTQ